MTGNTHLENIIEQTGGCGRYQLILCFIIHMCKLVFLTIMILVFGGVIPDWWCVDDILEHNRTLQFLQESNSSLFKSCINANGTTCKTFYFEGSVNTLISEWNLVCDNKWISSTITSVQMAGFFIGCLGGGQLADLIGRKPPFYISIAMAAILSLVSAFSTTWTMFAAIRFFIGIVNGVQVTVMYNIQMEFVLPRWRTWVVAVPSWHMTVMSFCLIIYLLPDWRHINIVITVLSVMCFLTFWFVPESFRWKVVHNQTKDAQKIIHFVAKVNKMPIPSKQEIEDVAAIVQGSESEEKDRKYTLIDLVRSRTVRKHTAMLFFIWISLGLGSYGVGFGVAALSGKLYENLLITAAINIVLQFLIIFLQGRYGRKKTAIFFFCLFSLFSAIVGIVNQLEANDTNLLVTRVCGLLALTSSEAPWSPIQTLSMEIYPTVIRNTGYGFQNTMARVGAILAPQLVFLDSMFPGTLYFVCAAISLISAILITQLPETSRKDLEDRLPEKGNCLQKDSSLVEKMHLK